MKFKNIKNKKFEKSYKVIYKSYHQIKYRISGEKNCYRGVEYPLIPLAYEYSYTTKL